MTWKDEFKPVAKLLKSEAGLPDALERARAIMLRLPTVAERMEVFSEWHKKSIWNRERYDGDALERALVEGLPREKALQDCLDIAAAGGPRAGLAISLLPRLVADADADRVLGYLLAAARSPKADLAGAAAAALAAMGERHPERVAPRVEELLRSKSKRDVQAGLALVATPAGRALLPLALERARHLSLLAHVPGLLTPSSDVSEVARVADTLASVRAAVDEPQEVRLDAGSRALETARRMLAQDDGASRIQPLVERFAHACPPDLRPFELSAFEQWAGLLLRAGRPSDAARAAREALGIAEDAVAHSPRLSSVHVDHARALQLLGDAALAAGDAEEAARRYREALEIARELHDAPTDEPWTRHGNVMRLAHAQARVALAMAALGRSAEAERSRAEARHLAEGHLAAGLADDPRADVEALLRELREAGGG